LRASLTLRRSAQRGDQAADAARLFLVRKAMEVQLKRVRHEARSHPHPRLALVIQPAVGAEEVVHQLIEVIVVTELDVAAEIPREACLVDDRSREAARALSGFAQQPLRFAACEQAPRRAETRRARADDQHGRPRHDSALSTAAFPRYVFPLITTSSRRRVSARIAARTARRSAATRARARGDRREGKIERSASSVVAACAGEPRRSRRSTRNPFAPASRARPCTVSRW